MNDTQPFYIEIANWAQDEKALRSVRFEVFVREQHVEEREEWDDLDQNALHVLAKDADGQPIGTGRLTTDAKIGRMAVLAPWRNQGVGEAMLRTLLEAARERHMLTVFLHAQEQAIPFYEAAGFACQGERFHEAGIPHRKMILRLVAGEENPHRKQRLPDVASIRSLGEAQSATEDLIVAAKHKLWIFTKDLDSLLLDRDSCIAGIKDVALSGRGAEVCILLQEPLTTMRNDHRLLPLLVRLDSHIAVRTPEHEEDLAYHSAFILNDAQGYFFRPLATRFEGEYSARNPQRHQELLNGFLAVWERSVPPAELRRLVL